MNLVDALAKAGVRWTLAAELQASPRGRMPTTALVLRMDLGVSGKESAKKFDLQTNLSLEHMLALVLRKNAQTHPVYQAWLRSRGNVPVELVLDEDGLVGIGEPMHTALRKLCDSKQSSITWNALHHIHVDDRIAVWTAAAAVMRSAFDGGASGKNPPTRRQVAERLRDALADATLPMQRPGRRSEGQTFAMRMLHTGCELTEMDEWMWGWLGYVVRDIDPDSDADAPESDAALATAA